MLEQERAYFAARLAEWLPHYGRKFVLVKGDHLCGVFDTPDAALAEGGWRFGCTSFLVRRVQREPEVVYAPALTLGILVPLQDVGRRAE